MAASNTFIRGVKYVLQAGGSTFAGGENADVLIAHDPIETTRKTTNLFRTLDSGTLNWAMNADGVLLVGGNPITSCPVLQLAADGGVLGTMEAQKEIQFAFSMSPIAQENCTNGNWDVKLAGGRSFTLSGQFDYLDPLGSGGPNQAVLFTQLKNRAKMDLDLAFGGSLSWAMEGFATQWKIVAAGQDLTRIELTIEITGQPVQTGTMGTGLEALIASTLATDQTEVTTKFTSAPQTGDTGAMHLTGSSLVTGWTFSGGYKRRADVSLSVVGTGTLTDAADA